MSGERSVVDPPDLVVAFVEMIRQHPDALVASIGDDGILTEMPTSVPLAGHRVAVGRSVIDMVVGADKVAVISTWERSRHDGGASDIVHLLTDPDQPVLLTIVDAVAEFGVHLAALMATNGSTGKIGHGSIGAVAPRTARIVKTELAIIKSVDTATALILGWHPDEMIGRRSLDFVHPDDQERSISNWMEMLTAPGHEQRVRLRHRAADGSWVWLEVTNRNMLNSADPCVVAEMLDISEELAAQEALRASEQRLRRLAESLPLGVLQIETDRRISYANARLAEITGAVSADVVDEQFCHVAPGDRPNFEAALAAVLEGGADQDLSIDFIDTGSPDAEHGSALRHCTMSMRSLTNDIGAVTGAIVCVSDDSDQVRMTAELEQRATFDALTGCFNRLSIMSRLETSLTSLPTTSGPSQPAGGVAIVFVDLNDFKAVNDELGHAVGDAMLCGVAGLLRQGIRDGDIVGRVGGDEFLVVCPDIADLDEALALAARIDTILEKGVEIGERRLVVTASLGVAHTNDPDTSSDRLVADADTKMYAEKRDRQHRRGTSASAPRTPLFRRSSDSESMDLRDAIRAGDLEVHYQPIVDIASGDPIGLEALIRWRRGTEIRPAAAFIATAESSGLITDIGELVVADSMSNAANAPASYADVRWFINMSTMELASPSKVSDVRAALARHNLDASRLVVEVTEHSDLANSAEALRAVNDLANLGVAIALDDFGTGYASLALLRAMPVSYLKFDRSFTVDLGHDPIAGHLLETCMNLSDRLNMVVIAEGVETIEQRDQLVERGVQLAQGYLFAVPQTVSDLFGTECAARPLTH